MNSCLHYLLSMCFLCLLPSRLVIAQARQDEFRTRVSGLAPPQSVSLHTAINDKGQSAVVWSSFAPSDGTKEIVAKRRFQNIYCQLFEDNGAMKGAAFQVNQKNGHKLAPRIVMSSAEDFVVCWEDVGDRSENGGIQFQRFNFVTGRLGPEVTAFTNTDSVKFKMPRIAIGPKNQIAVTCTASHEAGKRAIFMSLHSGDGAQIVSPNKVADIQDHRMPGSSGYIQQIDSFCEVAINLRSEILVIWLDTTPTRRRNVYARGYQSDGQPVGSLFCVSELSEDQKAYQVIMKNNIMPQIRLSKEAQHRLNQAEQRAKESRMPSSRLILPKLAERTGGEFAVQWLLSGAAETYSATIDYDALVRKEQTTVTFTFPEGCLPTQVFERRCSLSGVSSDTDEIASFAHEIPGDPSSKNKGYPKAFTMSRGEHMLMLHPWGGGKERQGAFARFKEPNLQPVTEKPLSTLTRGDVERLSASLNENLQTFVAFINDKGNELVASRIEPSMWSGSNGSQQPKNSVLLSTGIQQSVLRKGESQVAPGIAVDQSGNAFVVWETNDYDIMGQRFDTSCRAVGRPFRVNSTTAFAQCQPIVSANSKSGFVVAWIGILQGNSPGKNCWTVFAQFYDLQGTPLGGEIHVANDEHDEQFSPSIHLNDDGSAWVAWEGIFNKESSSTTSVVWVQHIHPQQGILSQAMPVCTTGSPQAPKVLRTSQDDLLVAWTCRAAGKTDGLFGHYLNKSGQKKGAEFKLLKEQSIVSKWNLSVMGNAELRLAWVASNSGKDPLNGQVQTQLISLQGKQLEAMPTTIPQGIKANAEVLLATLGRTSPIVVLAGDGVVNLVAQSTSSGSWETRATLPCRISRIYKRASLTLPGVGYCAVTSDTQGSVWLAWINDVEDQPALFLDRFWIDSQTGQLKCASGVK